MGFLKLILNANNAEGIREAMRIAYRRQRSAALKQGTMGVYDAHRAGLFGAMSSRMAVNNIPVHEPGVWQEVAPFLLIDDPEVAVEALAEYAVYVERPLDTKLPGLREVVNRAVASSSNANEALVMMAAAGTEVRRWHGLLNQESRTKLSDIRQVLGMDVGHGAPDLAEESVPPEAQLATGTESAFDQHASDRALRFPPEWSVGRLSLLESRPEISSGAVDPDWVDWTDACGVVKVPSGHVVRLEVRKRGAQDFDFLRSLEPDDLAALVLPDNSSPPWPEVARLSGLRGLVLPQEAHDDAFITMAKLEKMEHLWCLQSRELEGPGLESVHNMPKLRVLDLAEGRVLSDSVFTAIGGHPNLSMLRLSDTPVRGQTLQRLEGCSSLKILWLDNTLVDDEAVQRIPSSLCLDEICLWGASVGDDAVRHLATLPELRDLNLGKTFVTDAGVRCLENLGMKQLVLAHTGISKASVPILARLTDLEYLSIEDTAIPDEAVNELRKALPRTRVRA